jgi:hypothetical protein
MTSCFVGIDPGFTGGLAAIIDGAPVPCLFEMPTVEYEVTRRRKGASKQGTETELATNRLVTIFESLKQHSPFVMIEKAQVRPATGGKGQGVVSQAKFFGQYTEIRGVLYALRIPFEPVHPATWKADVFRGQTRADEDENESAKELSRLKAIQLFPMLAERLALKKTHGLAEALLIASFAQRRHGSQAPF